MAKSSCICDILLADQSAEARLSELAEIYPHSTLIDIREALLAGLAEAAVSPGTERRERDALDELESFVCGRCGTVRRTAASSVRDLLRQVAPAAPSSDPA